MGWSSKKAQGTQGNRKRTNERTSERNTPSCSSSISCRLSELCPASLSTFPVSCFCIRLRYIYIYIRVCIIFLGWKQSTISHNSTGLSLSFLHWAVEKYPQVTFHFTNIGRLLLPSQNQGQKLRSYNHIHSISFITPWKINKITWRMMLCLEADFPFFYRGVLNTRRESKLTWSLAAKPPSPNPTHLDPVRTIANCTWFSTRNLSGGGEIFPKKLQGEWICIQEKKTGKARVKWHVADINKDQFFESFAQSLVCQEWFFGWLSYLDLPDIFKNSAWTAMVWGGNLALKLLHNFGRSRCAYVPLCLDLHLHLHLYIHLYLYNKMCVCIYIT